MWTSLATHALHHSMVLPHIAAVASTCVLDTVSHHEILRPFVAIRTALANWDGVSPGIAAVLVCEVNRARKVVERVRLAYKRTRDERFRFVRERFLASTTTVRGHLFDDTYFETIEDVAFETGKGTPEFLAAIAHVRGQWKWGNFESVPSVRYEYALAFPTLLDASSTKRKDGGGGEGGDHVILLNWFTPSLM